MIYLHLPAEQHQGSMFWAWSTYIYLLNSTKDPCSGRDLLIPAAGNGTTLSVT